jgi:hypothetical protein
MARKAMLYSQTLPAEKQRIVDSRRPDSSSMDLEKAALLNQSPYHAATCRIPRMTPEPSAAANGIWRLIEGLTFAFAGTVMVFGFLEVADKWSLSAEKWRWMFFGVTLMYALQWMLTFAGMLMGALNESYFLRAAEGKSSGQLDNQWMTQTVRGMPCLNFPYLRFGFAYSSLVTGALIADLSYFHMQIQEAPGTDPDLTLRVGDRRAFHVKIWIMTLILFIDVLVHMVDYLELIHVGLSQDDRDGACHDIHCKAAKHPEGHDQKVIKFRVLSGLLEFGIAAGFIVAVVYLCEQLTFGFERFWAPHAWYLFDGILAIILGVVWLLTVASMVATYSDPNDRCLYRSACHAWLFWSVWFFWVGTNWYFTLQFTKDDKHLTYNTDELLKREYENMLWVKLLAYGSYIYFLLYHHFKCQVNVVVQQVISYTIQGI